MVALDLRDDLSDDEVGELRWQWLVARADLPCDACTAGNCPAGCEFFAGYLRFYGDPRPESYLIVKGGKAGWSERPGRFTALTPPDSEDQA
jgi:hypothetical protein